MGRELKLFVWEGEGVLRDHTNGLICVLAYDFEHALKLIEKKEAYSMISFPITKFRIVETPEAFLCHGGG